MASGRWRIASGLLVVPAVVGGLAGCSGGGGQSAAVSATASTTASNGSFNAAKLQKALLTQVNGVAAAAPATSGKYSSVAQASASKQASGVTVSPKACSQAATEGFDPSALSGAPAAGVTFQVGTNGVSELLISSTAKSASTALAGQVPAGCTKYSETVDGKTLTYSLAEEAVSGIGAQAKVLNVHPVSGTADDLWSLIYRGTGFVGTVTVIGPNASEAAVKELGQQAYAFAVKSLA
jgi:hypothetical protein